MNILFVDIVRTSLEEVWPSVEHSLGLMYLCSVLKQSFGDRVRLRISTLVSRPGRAEEDRNWAMATLAEFEPDMIGIRSLSIGKDALHLLVDAIRRWSRGCFLVVGGPHATDDPEDALCGGTVDCAVVGEGETTTAELVGKLLCGDSVRGIPGIAYMENGSLKVTPSRPVISELDSIPFPDYSLVDLASFKNRYLTFSSKIYNRHANLLTTRGCPFRCMYCHNILGKRFRARSPENVLAEMRSLYDDHGVDDFQIVDDIFNFDRSRAIRICDLILKSGMKITLSLPNGVRGDMMDEELIDRLAAVGTKFISYAIETASPRLQRLIRKNLNLDKVFRAIEYTAKKSIITRGYFMFGFPTETEEEVLRSIEYAKSSSLCGATFFTVVYFPGTELYRLAQSLRVGRKEEYAVSRDYVETAEGPYNFSLAKLIELKKKAVREFAFTKERIENALKILPNYFNQREIDGFFMAYAVSSGLTLKEVPDETVKRLLRKYFIVAERFSKKDRFYV